MKIGNKKPQFVFDVRESNPKLHILYVKWACIHLRTVDRMISDLDGMGSLNLTDMICAIRRERDKLVLENAAYADADDIVSGNLDLTPLPPLSRTNEDDAK